MLTSLGINVDMDMLAICTAASALIALISLTVSIINNRKLKRIMKNCSMGDLDSTIITYYKNVAELSDDFKAALVKFDTINSNLTLGIQKSAALRYDAFSDQPGFSYSIALLNGKDDGAVMTSIFGRNTCNNYLKIIAGGKSSEKLSDEEQSVIDKAIADHAAKFIK